MKKRSFQQELPPSLQKLLALKTQTCQTKETNRTMVLVIIEWKTSSQFFTFELSERGHWWRTPPSPNDPSNTLDRERVRRYRAPPGQFFKDLLQRNNPKWPLKKKLKWDCKLRTRNKRNVILQITQEPLPLAHYKGVHWQQRKQFRVLGT